MQSVLVSIATKILLLVNFDICRADITIDFSSLLPCIGYLETSRNKRFYSTSMYIKMSLIGKQLKYDITYCFYERNHTRRMQRYIKIKC